MSTTTVWIGHSDAGEVSSRSGGMNGSATPAAACAGLQKSPLRRRVGPPARAAPPTRPAAFKNSRRFIPCPARVRRDVTGSVFAGPTERVTRASRQRVDDVSALVTALTEVLERLVEVDDHEQPLSLGGHDPVDAEGPARHDAAPVHLLGPGLEGDRAVQR